ncbi:hypothetical protein K450DRAFT_218696 [Umbelopsis ramanniana AG]|uniref:Uncharacterized protein n=1 Tax=Umbelopsis ramanniana AG TaxID=1314678 RepID=A0AAD5EJN0_UMBRA|nr:uncharacterized protein K450DRAFT_218696 [Umbelopsis ramanniana AG]KAI8584216.1 hypothetical protein K450DRAFT_218696 [Umbelopsis ramanniana AG]
MVQLKTLRRTKRPYGFLKASSRRCNSASSSAAACEDSLIGLLVGTEAILPLIEMPISSNT